MVKWSNRRTYFVSFLMPSIIQRAGYSSSENTSRNKRKSLSNRWLWRSEWSRSHERSEDFIVFIISGFDRDLMGNSDEMRVVFLHWASNCAWRIKGGVESCNPTNIEVIYASSQVPKAFVAAKKLKRTLIHHTVNKVAKLKPDRCFHEVNDRGSLRGRRFRPRRLV